MGDVKPYTAEDLYLAARSLSDATTHATASAKARDACRAALAGHEQVTEKAAKDASDKEAALLKMLDAYRAQKEGGAQLYNAAHPDLRPPPTRLPGGGV